MTGTE